MSQMTYRTSVYRGAYAALFVGMYLLLAAYLLSGDDSGSDSSSGVWRLLIGMLLAAAVGTGFGPALHRKIFPRRTRRHPRHHISRHSSK